MRRLLLALGCAALTSACVPADGYYYGQSGAVVAGPAVTYGVGYGVGYGYGGGYGYPSWYGGTYYRYGRPYYARPYSYGRYYSPYRRPYYWRRYHRPVVY